MPRKHKKSFHIVDPKYFNHKKKRFLIKNMKLAVPNVEVALQASEARRWDFRIQKTSW